MVARIRFSGFARKEKSSVSTLIFQETSAATSNIYLPSASYSLPGGPHDETGRIPVEQTSMRVLLSSLLGILFCTNPALVFARDLRITFPGRSELTPVQRLNREGVDAVEKHQYEKAEGIFYKAYLYDPADPFTLNNLGYISELQGQLDRAETFYRLATEQGCDARIDRTNDKDLKGKPMLDALDTLKNIPMRVNRMNVMGIELLSQDRGFEAEALLRKALALEPQNPFTLNNLGVAEESIGDLPNSLQDYDAAAVTRAMEPVVVTLKKSARGRPVSEVASESAEDLRKRMKKMDLNRVRATMLALRGVFEVNQNDWVAAKKDFLEEYSLDPRSAFALNNLGYVAERDGDPETAQFYYDKARRASGAGARIGLATASDAKGQHLSAIADDSNQKVNTELDVYTRSRQGEEGPIELTPRYGSLTTPEPTPARPAPQSPSPQPSTNPPPQ
jgi:Flp pilus assembly protein TadD